MQNNRGIDALRWLKESSQEKILLSWREEALRKDGHMIWQTDGL